MQYVELFTGREATRTNLPSLWIVGTYVLREPVSDQLTPYVLVRKQNLLCQDGTNLDYLHILGSPVDPRFTINGDETRPSMNLPAMANAMFRHYTGFPISVGRLRAEAVYHESTYLFSGPEEARQVKICHVQLNSAIHNNHYFALPEIRNLDADQIRKSDLENDDAQVQAVNNEREKHYWVNYRSLLDSIEQKGEPDTCLYNPETTPFVATNIELTKGGDTATQTMTLPVPSTVLYALEKTGRHVFINAHYDAKHPLNNVKVSDTLVRRARIRPEFIL